MTPEKAEQIKRAEEILAKYVWSAPLGQQRERELMGNEDQDFALEAIRKALLLEESGLVKALELARDHLPKKIAEALTKLEARE